MERERRKEWKCYTIKINLKILKVMEESNERIEEEKSYKIHRK
jgi:hypothetical protein